MDYLPFRSYYEHIKCVLVSSTSEGTKSHINIYKTKHAKDQEAFTEPALEQVRLSKPLLFQEERYLMYPGALSYRYFCMKLLVQNGMFIPQDVSETTELKLFLVTYLKHALLPKSCLLKVSESLLQQKEMLQLAHSRYRMRWHDCLVVRQEKAMGSLLAVVSHFHGQNKLICITEILNITEGCNYEDMN